jgi:hypothetical protein
MLPWRAVLCAVLCCAVRWIHVGTYDKTAAWQKDRLGGCDDVEEHCAYWWVLMQQHVWLFWGGCSYCRTVPFVVLQMLRAVTGALFTLVGALLFTHLLC